MKFKILQKLTHQWNLLIYNKKNIIISMFIILLAPVLVLAVETTINLQTGCSDSEPCLTPPGIQEGETSDFTDLLHWLLSFMLYAAGILAVFMLVVGGVQYVLAGSMGNPEKIGDAQSRILSALGGLILALGAWIILYTINPKLLNIDINLQNIPNTTIPGGGNTTVPGGGNTTAGGINVSQYQWKHLETNQSCETGWAQVETSNCPQPMPSDANTCCAKRQN